MTGGNKSVKKNKEAIVRVDHRQQSEAAPTTASTVPLSTG